MCFKSEAVQFFITEHGRYSKTLKNTVGCFINKSPFTVYSCNTIEEALSAYRKYGFYYYDIGSIPEEYGLDKESLGNVEFQYIPNNMIFLHEVGNDRKPIYKDTGHRGFPDSIIIINMGDCFQITADNNKILNKKTALFLSKQIITSF